MANATTCVNDVWSTHNNVAGLSDVEIPQAAFSLHAIPKLAFLNRMAACLAIPAGSVVVGLGAFRFGDDLYNEHIGSLAIANKFGLASLGARLNYVQYRTEGAGTRRVISAGFGGLATLTPHLRFGAHILHVNQPIVDPNTDERLPARMAAGMAYAYGESLLITAEVDKELGYPSSIKAGVEYCFFQKITFRTGFSLNPDAGFVGIGFRTSRFQLDYAAQLNHVVGLNHQASVLYGFKKK